MRILLTIVFTMMASIAIAGEAIQQTPQQQIIIPEEQLLIPHPSSGQRYENPLLGQKYQDLDEENKVRLNRLRKMLDQLRSSKTKN